jgi:hypothetical protein
MKPTLALLAAVATCSPGHALGDERKPTPVEFCNVFLTEHSNMGMFARAHLCVSNNVGDTPLARCMNVLRAADEAVPGAGGSDFREALWCRDLIGR